MIAIARQVGHLLCHLTKHFIEPFNRGEDRRSVDEDHYDKAQLNYDAIYKRVLAIDSSLSGYVEQLKKLIKPPQLREEVTLIHHAKEGNLYARERLITNDYPLTRMSFPLNTYV